MLLQLLNLGVMHELSGLAANNSNDGTFRGKMCFFSSTISTELLQGVHNLIQTHLYLGELGRFLEFQIFFLQIHPLIVRICALEIATVMPGTFTKNLVAT